jgi:hypothetical protein
VQAFAGRALNLRAELLVQEPRILRPAQAEYCHVP